MTDVLPCNRNQNNESEIDLLSMPIYGQPTFADLNIDFSNFTNPMQIIDGENVLYGNQLEQHTQSNNDNDYGIDDVEFQLADQGITTNVDLFHVPMPARHGLEARKSTQNAPSLKFLESFQL